MITPAAAAVTSARDITVRYGGRTVLDVAALSLTPGRTLALLGPNGSGKSTLLRVLALLERPASGRLEVLGEALTGAESQRLRLRRRMATVFQDPLLTDQTVFDNVAMGLRFRGLGGDQVTARVNHWLEKLGISSLAGRPARTLSGGEAQRVSLARAFVLEPEVLFLDEPFGSLDLQGRETLALELEAILREARIATVLVTHDRGEAQLLGDEVAVLLDGRVAQCAAVRQVFLHPASAAVARFLGIENLIRCAVTGPGEIELAGTRARVPPDSLTGPTVLACFRAEDVHLSAPGSGGESGDIRLAARVVHLVPYGVPYRIHLDAGGIPLVALAARRTVERLGVGPGTELVVSFDAEALHLLPDEAGTETRTGAFTPIR